MMAHTSEPAPPVFQVVMNKKPEERGERQDKSFSWDLASNSEIWLIFPSHGGNNKKDWIFDLQKYSKLYLR